MLETGHPPFDGCSLGCPRGDRHGRMTWLAAFAFGRIDDSKRTAKRMTAIRRSFRDLDGPRPTR